VDAEGKKFSTNIEADGRFHSKWLNMNQHTATLRKEVQLSPEFTALWERIKPKTTFRVEFSTPAAGAARLRPFGRLRVVLRSSKDERRVSVSW
jgi:hypothetical protein